MPQLDPRSMQMPGQPPSQNTTRVGVGDNFLQIEATIIDAKGLDKLIEILKENRKFLPNAT